jgi:hypothetical protein
MIDTSHRCLKAGRPPQPIGPLTEHQKDPGTPELTSAHAAIRAAMSS